MSPAATPPPIKRSDMVLHAGFRPFVYDGRYASGRRVQGVVSRHSPQAAVGWLMDRGVATAHVFETCADVSRLEVGGISQERKGARRRPWWQEDTPHASSR
ncbi:MAG: hypothetical protein ACRDQH_06120 [Pseudonocardiaceae bacterium]